MDARYRPGERSGFGISFHRSRFLLVGLLCFVAPALAFYCWHYSSEDGVSPSTGNRDTFTLEARSSYSPPDSWMQRFLNPIANRRFEESTRAGRKDPFGSATTRDLAAMQADPFMLALASGNGEGVLVQRRMNGRIPILGPSMPRSAGNGPSDAEILKAIQAGAGGSFRSFYSSLFGSQSHDSAQAADSSAVHDENPFTKAVSSLAETTSTDKSSTAGDQGKQTKGTQDQGSSDAGKKSGSSASTVLSPSAPGPSHPSLLMKVGDDKTFQPMAVSQIRDGTFESSEMGVRDFAVLPFSDAAEFPIAIAVADFNGDGYPDVAFHVSQQGLLRFFYGSQDGSFEEGLQIEAGRGPRSIAVGDFNHDGMTDIAISDVGTGGVTLLFADSQGGYRYKSFWSDVYRDYIMAADTRGSGTPDLLGLTFSNQATVLSDFNQPNSGLAGISFDYTPSLFTSVFTATGRTVAVDAVLLGSSLSVNINNRMNQLTSVLNVATGMRVYVVVGDLGGDGRMCVGLAIPRP